MLIPAKIKEKELQEKYIKCVYDKRFKFVCGLGGYRTMSLKIDDDDWMSLQLISYDDINNKIIGYVNLKITRPSNNIHNIAIYNFTSNVNLIFINDLKNLFIKIFKEFKFPKATFSVVVGNPIETSYDNMVKNYGGRVVGIFKNEEFIDNKYYDVKWYEIIRDDFLMSIK